MGQLQHAGGDGPVVRCKLCSRAAAGPCARCKASVCGDCSVLTDGGATTFAICLACAEGGTSLRRPWLGLIAWTGAIALILAAVAAALILLRT